MKKWRYPSRLSKFGNVKQNGFHSKREAARYEELLLLVKAGEISELEKQKRFDLKVNDRKICAYYADFCYTRKDGVKVIEDVKGFQTDVFKIKWKLLQSLHGEDYEYLLT